jgi:hypothetical protein
MKMRSRGWETRLFIAFFGLCGCVFMAALNPFEGTAHDIAQIIGIAVGIGFCVFALCYEPKVKSRKEEEIGEGIKGESRCERSNRRSQT